jgi:hypothetical protein
MNGSLLPILAIALGAGAYLYAVDKVSAPKTKTQADVDRLEAAELRRRRRQAKRVNR